MRDINLAEWDKRHQLEVRTGADGFTKIFIDERRVTEPTRVINPGGYVIAVDVGDHEVWVEPWPRTDVGPIGVQRLPGIATTTGVIYRDNVEHDLGFTLSDEQWYRLNENVASRIVSRDSQPLKFDAPTFDYQRESAPPTAPDHGIGYIEEVERFTTLHLWVAFFLGVIVSTFVPMVWGWFA